jgi:C-terminal domain of alpha-glycerophosphate oxidase
VHNEYAETPIDFLARRSRLTFLNSNIALDALPRVAEIMGDELGWSKRRRNKEIRDAEIFMESMGVPFGARRYRVGWREWAAGWAGWLARVARGGSGAAMDDEVIAGAVRHAASISRAQFDPGEIDRLKASFGRRVPALSANKEARWLPLEDVRTLVEEKINLGWCVDTSIQSVIQLMDVLLTETYQPIQVNGIRCQWCHH